MWFNKKIKDVHWLPVKKWKAQRSLDALDRYVKIDPKWW